MTPPRLAEAGTEFERELVASARLDVGGKDGLKRTLVALGVSAGTLSVGASTAAAGVGAGGAAGAAGGTAWVGGAGTAVLVKWIGIALFVSGSAALSAAPVVRRIRATTASTASPRAVPAALAGRTSRPVTDPHALAEPAPDLASLRAAPTESASMPPIAVPAPSHPAHPPSVPVPPPTPLPVPLRAPSSLSAELAMLDPVRTSLARHDAPAALRQLDVFDRAFPASVLADEALVLRVDALVARGDRAEAEALGRSFLATHPASPHAPHLLRQLGGTHNP